MFNEILYVLLFVVVLLLCLMKLSFLPKEQKVIGISNIWFEVIDIAFENWDNSLYRIYFIFGNISLKIKYIYFILIWMLYKNFIFNIKLIKMKKNRVREVFIIIGKLH